MRDRVARSLGSMRLVVRSEVGNGCDRLVGESFRRRLSSGPHAPVERALDLELCSRGCVIGHVRLFVHLLRRHVHSGEFREDHRHSYGDGLYRRMRRLCHPCCVCQRLAHCALDRIGVCLGRASPLCLRGSRCLSAFGKAEQALEGGHLPGIVDVQCVQEFLRADAVHADVARNHVPLRSGFRLHACLDRQLGHVVLRHLCTDDWHSAALVLRWRRRRHYVGNSLPPSTARMQHVDVDGGHGISDLYGGSGGLSRPLYILGA
mmetsp:Transcript_101740/g.294422  ORF Transcript_101740/g.294422 Transcript_101740/m.294422 type:complete len:262 (+) Transcript_101740:530-1315(+)